MIVICFLNNRKKIIIIKILVDLFKVLMNMGILLADFSSWTVSVIPVQTTTFSIYLKPNYNNYNHFGEENVLVRSYLVRFYKPQVNTTYLWVKLITLQDRLSNS